MVVPHAEEGMKLHRTASAQEMIREYEHRLLRTRHVGWLVYFGVWVALAALTAMIHDPTLDSSQYGPNYDPTLQHSNYSDAP